MTAPLEARRVPPHNLDAEDAVIGGILFAGRRAFDLVSGLLRPNDFYQPTHGAIFEACLACEGLPIDLITVDKKLRDLGLMPKLLAQGENAYLVELANRSGTAENIVAHAQLVVDAALGRQIILATSDIQAHAYAGLAGLDLIEAAQSRLFDLGTRYQGLEEPKPLKPLLHSAFQRLEARMNNQSAVTGLATGFTGLDRITRGWKNGHLIVVCGRPGHGKSALAMQTALYAAVAEQAPTLVFHLEMLEDEVVDRALSMDSRVPNDALDTGYLTSDHWVKLTKTASRLSEGRMWIDDSTPLSIGAMAAKARRWRSDPKLFPPGLPPRGLVVVDYLQLIRSLSKRARSRLEEVSEISHSLKGLAKELRLPVMAVASLSRKCEERVDKRPVASDLRESGDIESDANLIIAVYRDELYDDESPDRDVAEVIIRKHRGGQTGTVRLAFSGPTTRFDDLPEDRNR